MPPKCQAVKAKLNHPHAQQVVIIVTSWKQKGTTFQKTRKHPRDPGSTMHKSQKKRLRVMCKTVPPFSSLHGLSCRRERNRVGPASYAFLSENQNANRYANKHPPDMCVGTKPASPIVFVGVMG